MSRVYEVRARGSRVPVWSAKAPSRKSALDKVAKATRLPRHCLVAAFVATPADPRPRFPEDDE